MQELNFNLEIDEEGNYCASAKVPDGLLATDARDLNSLVEMIRDVVALYSEEMGLSELPFALHFPSGLAA